MAIAVPYLGHGVGLRPPHFPRLWDGTARVDWFEAISENFMVRAVARWRCSSGSARERPSCCTASRCPSAPPIRWTSVPRRAAALDRAVRAGLGLRPPVLERRRRALRPRPPAAALHRGGARARRRARRRVQERLGRQILLENVSSYVDVRPLDDDRVGVPRRRRRARRLRPPARRQQRLRQRREPRLRPRAYIAGLPADRVGQIHLAGHTDMGTYLFDTHDGPVRDPVWELYRTALRRFGRVSTLVEWDEHIPELDVVAPRPSARARPRPRSWRRRCCPCVSSSSASRRARAGAQPSRSRAARRS